MSRQVILVYCEVASLQENTSLSFFPVGLFSISAFLNQHGYRCGVWSGTSYQWDDLCKTIVKHQPAIIGFSAGFDNFYLVKSWCRAIKESFPDVLIVIGGPQAIVFDEEDFAESLADVVVLGEGEVTMLELCQWFLDDYGSLSEIKGVRYLKNNTIKDTSDRPLIQNLDALPFPRSEDALYPCNLQVYPVITGRGCPFNCAFCYEGSLKQKNYRVRSVEHLEAELNYVFTHHPVKYIIFVDDTFTLRRKRLQKITQLLKKFREKYDFIWFCEAHVRSVLAYQPEFKDMMKAGLYRVQLGIESGDDKTLYYYRKKTNREMIIKAVELLTNSDDNYCNIIGNFILGGPFENDSSINASIELAQKLLKLAPGKIDLHLVFLAFYPETPITKHPENFGILPLCNDPKGRMVWWSMYDPVASTRDFSEKELLEIFQEFSTTLETTMKSLIFKVSVKVFYRLFYHYFKFHTYSSWIKIVQQFYPYIWSYFWHIFKGGFISILHTSIQSDKIQYLKPYRLISWADMNKNHISLCHEERQVLQYATGKFTLQDIARNLKFTLDTIILIAKKLEHQYLIVFMDIYKFSNTTKIKEVD